MTPLCVALAFDLDRAIIILAIAAAILLIIATATSYFAPARDADRIARRGRKRVQTLITSENNRDIIGDGACAKWEIKPARYPNSCANARMREQEPRGM